MSLFVVESWASQDSEAQSSRRAIARTIRIFGVVGLVAAAALVLAKAPRPASVAEPPVPAVAAPAWQEIAAPVHIYTLAAPDFEGVPLAYTARRHVAGGGREDMLSLGTFDGSGPAIRLRIFRRAAEAPSATPLFAAIAHEAAQAGLSVGRSGLPEIMPTKFGRFEIADVALEPSTGGPALPCRGFRLIRDVPALSITGLACGAGATAPARATLGCLVDRLDIAAAGDDHDLIDFFTTSELQRDMSCPGAAPNRVDAAPEVASPKAGKAATGRKSLRRR